MHTIESNNSYIRKKRNDFKMDFLNLISIKKLIN